MAQDFTLKPTVGRTVHYQARGSADGHFPSVPRAALVTQVHGDGTTVGLCVLNPSGQFFNESVAFGGPEQPGTWSWPPRDDVFVPTPRAAFPSDADLQAIAEACHEVNRAWCEHIKDHGTPPWAWADAPDWQKESCLDGVRFHLDNPDAGDAASHNNWMAHKEADGWVYGPVKDAEKKTHPCLVPFEQLPFEQQAKDRLFRTTVHALAKALRGPLPKLNLADVVAEPAPGVPVGDLAEVLANPPVLNLAEDLGVPPV